MQPLSIARTVLAGGSRVPDPTQIDVRVFADVPVGAPRAHLEDVSRLLRSVLQVVTVGDSVLEARAIPGAQHFLPGVGHEYDLAVENPDKLVLRTVPVSLAGPGIGRERQQVDAKLRQSSRITKGGAPPLLVEIRRGTLSRVTPDGARATVAELGGGSNGAAIGPDGAVSVCNNDGAWLWREGDVHLPGDAPRDYRGGSIQRVGLASGTATTLYALCDGKPLNSPNDIVFDVPHWLDALRRYRLHGLGWGSRQPATLGPSSTLSCSRRSHRCSVGSRRRPPRCRCSFGGLLADGLSGVRVLLALLLAIALLNIAFAKGMPSLAVSIALLAALYVCFGLGNGATFQLVPQRWMGRTGIMTGLIGAAGGIGGFDLPVVMGLAKESTGSYQLGFAVFAALATLALGLVAVLHKRSRLGHTIDGENIPRGTGHSCSRRLRATGVSYRP